MLIYKAASLLNRIRAIDNGAIKPQEEGTQKHVASVDSEQQGDSKEIFYYFLVAFFLEIRE